jgi:oxygen-dependent protoporphyrinogen oxidase
MPPELHTRRIAVIGGGISGLSAAYRLIELSRESSRPIEVTLFEASDRLGGIIHTTRFEECLVDEGPDSFITNKPWGIDLCRRLGLDDRLIPTDNRFRKSLILHRGRPVETPEGFNLLAPAKTWPFIKSPLLSWSGKLRMLSEWFVPPRCDGIEESLEQFVVRRFGREALERIIQPMVGGIYTSDPSKLSLQATLPRFVEMEREYGSVIRGLRSGGATDVQASGARYGLFVSLQDGMGELVDGLQQAIGAAARIELRTRVTSMHAERDRILLELQSDREGEAPAEPISELKTSLSAGSAGASPSRKETFDGVILALAAHHSSALLRAGEQTELADALAAIPYASSAILVSVHRSADIRHPLDAFGLVIPHVERRRILAVSFLHRKFAGRAPEGIAILRTFAGGELQPELLTHDDSQLKQIVLDELRDVLGVKGEPLFAKLSRYPNAMPQFHVGHGDRVARIRAAAARLPWLALAGNYIEGVGIPDAIHSGEQAAEQLWNRPTAR